MYNVPNRGPHLPPPWRVGRQKIKKMNLISTDGSCPGGFVASKLKNQNVISTDGSCPGGFGAKKLKKGTISFIRSERRNGFYFVDKKNTIEPKTFLETAEIFKSNKAAPKIGNDNININKEFDI